MHSEISDNDDGFTEEYEPQSATQDVPINHITLPTRANEDYIGEYGHPAFGNYTVYINEDTLRYRLEILTETITKYLLYNS